MAADTVAKTQDQPVREGERRHLTILFCDVVDSTEIATRLDAEQWHDVAAQYQRASAQVMSALGGHVLKFLGDGLVVCFGYPRAMEDAAERAVRAGLGVIQAAAKISEQLGDALDRKLQVRVGVHSGSVVMAQGGGGDMDMFGEAPNIAARVQAVAAPDSVVITDATHTLVSGLFVVEDLGAHSLKGISVPMRLHRVLGAGLSRRRDFSAQTSTPFVGRDDELHALRRRWEHVRAGEGQHVLLTGEPGIGKSRLIEEFHALIKGDAHLWVASACEELFNSTPLHAVTQMLHQGLGWRGDETADQRVTLLERALRASEVNVEEALPLIAEQLGLPLVTRSAAQRYAPEQKRKRLFAAMTDWVLGAAKLQPLVVIVEDLHWADPSTVEWLQMLADQGAHAPLLLLCTARPEFRSPWPTRSHHAQLALNRLSDQQTRDMVSLLAARSGLTDAAIEGVVKRTDGVPLFAEELARLLFSADAKASEHDIPATLKDSLTARLDRVGNAKDAALIGSVIGREFSYELLAAVWPQDEATLLAALTALAKADIINTRGIPPNATFQFKHALIQDAAYEALLKSRRAQLHAHVAQTLETKFPELSEFQPQLLARQWSGAGQAEPAIAAWIKMARQADERSAFREAEGAYRQALSLLGTLPKSPERDEREIDILTPLIVVAASAANWNSREVIQLSDRAGILAARTGNLAQIVIQRFAATASSVSGGNIARSKALADQVSDLAQREGGELSLRCAHEAQIMALYPLGDFAGVEREHEQWVTLCERVGFGPFPGETTGVLGVVALCAWHLGKSDTARERADRAVELGRKSANPTDLLQALRSQATLFMMERDPGRTDAAAAEGLALSETHGLERTADSFRTKLAWARAYGGESEASAQKMRECIARILQDGSPGAVSDAIVRLAHVLKAAGAHEEAFATIDGFLRDYPDLVLIRPNGLHLRGELHRKLGRCKLAELDFTAALELAHSLGTKFVELRAATSLGRILHERGQEAEARDLVTPLYGAFTQGFDTADLKDAQALLDQLA
ncbi:MAG: AAA family ATPase [Vitreimonas sp.]